MIIRGNLGNRAGLAPLKQALNAYALRHRVIASNIANAETPGYQPRQVAFEEVARKALGMTSGVRGSATNPGHMAVGDAPRRLQAVIQDKPPLEGEEGGGVDLQTEMVDLAKNQLSYRLAVRLLDMKYNQLQSAIRGSSR